MSKLSSCLNASGMSQAEQSKLLERQAHYVAAGLDEVQAGFRVLTELKEQTLDSLQNLYAMLDMPGFKATSTALKTYKPLVKQATGRRRLDPNKVPKELLQLVGARIPNQGHNSMLPIEIVGFIPRNMGDLIIVPSAITKQMGADFDVDKLFTYKKPYKYEQGGFTVDTSAGTNNQLKTQYFDIHWAVLTHKDMYDRVLNPLDKKDLAEEATLLSSKVKGFNNYYHAFTQFQDFQSGKYAKELVGLTSLSVTFNAVLQDKSLILGNLENFKEVPYTIKFYTDEGLPITLTKLSGYGTSVYKGEIRTKHDNLTTIQSAAVDNAKNRTLDNLNLTPDTYKAIAALLMLETKNAEAVNLTYATRMLTSPILKKFSMLMAEGNDSLGDTYIPDLKEDTIATLKAELVKEILGKNLEATKSLVKELQEEFVLSPKTLLAEVTKPTPKGQLAILLRFEALDRVGSRLTELQSVLNQDTKGAGQSMLAAIDKVQKFDRIGGFNSGILGEDSLLANNTEQARTFNMIMNTAVQVVDSLLPYKSLVVSPSGGSSVFDQLKAQIGKPQLPLELQKQVVKSLRSYIYTSVHTLWPDASGERLRLMFNLEGKSLAQRVVEAKATWGKENHFLQRLDPIIGTLGAGPDFLEFASSQAASFDASMNVSAFMEILNSVKPEEKLLGEDLIRYSYLTGGIQDANSFISKIPVSYLIDSDFAKELRFAAGTLDTFTNSRGFIEQFFQHFPEKALQVDAKMFTNGETYEETIALSSLDRDGIPTDAAHSKYVTTDSKGESEYVDYLSFRSTKDGKYLLYRRAGDRHFVRIDTLGNSATDEYNADVPSGLRSIFAENRAIADQVTTMLDSPDDVVRKLTEGMENPANAFENFGMPDEGGGLEVAKTMLTTIAEDTRIPESLRTVAKVLSSTEEIEHAHEILLKSFKDAASTLSVVYLNSTNEDGSYNLLKSRIQLRQISDSSLAAETFVHEFLHHRTAGLVRLSGFSTELFRQGTRDQRVLANKIVADFNTKYPEVEKILLQLDNVRYQAYSALKSRIVAEHGEAYFEQMIQDVQNGQATTPDHTNLYALSTVDELIAYSLSSKPVAEFLNTVQVRGNKTLLDVIWEALSSILESVARTIGVQVKDGSALKEAITLSLKLATLNNNKDISVNIQAAIMENSPQEFSTERNAEEVKTLLENSYSKIVQLESMGTHIMMKSRDKNPHLVPGNNMTKEMQEVLDKLENQSYEFTQLLGRVPASEEQLRQNISSKQREVVEDIAKLTRETNIDTVTEIGVKQMRWVHTIMQKTEPTIQELAVATNIIDVWATIVDVVHSKDSVGFSTELAALMADARQTRKATFEQKAQAAFTKMAATRGIALSTADYNKDLKEMYSNNALFRSLNQAKSRLVAAMGVIGTVSAENAAEETKNYADKLDSVNLKVEALGYKTTAEKATLYKEFVQENEDKTVWGFVQQYSPEWFSFTKNLERDLDNKLEIIRSIGDPVDRKKKASAVYAAHWKKLNAASVFVDTRIFFDLVTGALLDNEHTVKEHAYLVEHLGSAEYADELIANAGKQYKKYLQIRDSAYTDIEAHAQLTAEEKAAITLTDEEKLLTVQEQADLLSKKEAAELLRVIEAEKTKWEGYKSPNLFFEAKFSNNIVSGFGSSLYTANAPRITKSQFYDVKHKALLANEAKLEIFNDLIAIRNEAVESLPVHIQDKLDDSFLPSVMVGETTDLLSRIGRLSPKSILNRGFKAATVSYYEANKQPEDRKQVPIDYINTRNIHNLKPEELVKRQEQIENWDTDLINVLEKFTRMTAHNKHMNKVLDAINLAETLVIGLNKARLDKTEEGQALTNTLKAIDYWKEAVVYKSSKQAQGISKEAIYSANPKEHIRVSKEVADLYEEREELWDKMMNDELDIAGTKRLNDVEDRLEELAKTGRYFAASKGADMLISFNQLRALAFNPFAAVTNLTFGLISVFVHANGRRDYTNKTALSALHEMRHAQKKWLSIGYINDAASQKIFNLMIRMNIINSVQSTSFAESNMDTKKKSALQNAVMPLGWQLSGDYFTKGTMMIAMMKHQKVKVVTNGIEKEVSLWDAHDSTGYWNEAEFGVNELWSSEDVEKQTSWSSFKRKTKAVSTIVFGNQDANSPLMGRKDVLWRILGQFRMSWLPEGIATRFQDEREDELSLGRTVKGRWRTYSDLGYLNSGLVLAKQLLSALPGVKMDAFSGVVNKKRQPISDVDKENMRKNLAGLMMTIGFLTAILSMKALLLPDDEEKKRRRRKGQTSTNENTVMLINMLTRNYQDLTLYSSPGVLEAVIGNPAPALTVITDSYKLLMASGKLLSDDPKKYEKWLKKAAKLVPGAANYPKFKYMTSKDISDISSN